MTMSVFGSDHPVLHEHADAHAHAHAHARANDKGDDTSNSSRSGGSGGGGSSGGSGGGARRIVFDAGPHPAHTHQPLVQCIVDELRAGRNVKAANGNANNTVAGASGGGGGCGSGGDDGDGCIGSGKLGSVFNGTPLAPSSVPSTGESALRTAAVMDVVLRRFYRQRSDHFWRRTHTYDNALGDEEND
jgi:hypothetical protein